MSIKIELTQDQLIEIVTQVQTQETLAPPPPSDELMDTSYEAVFGKPVAPGQFYSNSPVTNTSPAGTSMSIKLPAVIDKSFTLYIWDVETSSTPPYARYGVLSDRRDFDEPFYSEKSWGIGGYVHMKVTPEMAGKTVYFNHRIKEESQQFAPWMATLQAYCL